MNGTMNRSIRWMRVADDWKEGERERGRIEEGSIGSYKLPYTLFALFPIDYLIRNIRNYEVIYLKTFEQEHELI